MGVTTEEFEQANLRAARKRISSPRLLLARCAKGVLTVAFINGVELRVPVALIEGLARAPVSSLREIELSPSGHGLHFPALDADVYLPGLMKGIFGSRSWMKGIAAQLGAKGGKASTPAKRAAARANGSNGGRPKKALVA